MNHKPLALSALLTLSVLLASAALPALAIGRLADITVIDRSTGATLPVYSHRGEFWVAGTPGARYAISVRSKLGQRMMAVPAVDGINVLSGQTAAWHQSGYVFSSYSQHQITGWRKSDSEVAAFEFAALGDSYAALTGRPNDVGVIGVALFREKQPPAAELSAAPSVAPSPSSSRFSPTSRNEAGSTADFEASASRSAAPQAAQKLGTAHGQRETSVVSSTTFERQNARPDELVVIRYDSRANLVALGVIRPQPLQPVPNAFPESPAAYAPGFAADPPQRRY